MGVGEKQNWKVVIVIQMYEIICECNYIMFKKCMWSYLLVHVTCPIHSELTASNSLVSNIYYTVPYVDVFEWGTLLCGVVWLPWFDSTSSFALFCLLQLLLLNCIYLWVQHWTAPSAKTNEQSFPTWCSHLAWHMTVLALVVSQTVSPHCSAYRIISNNLYALLIIPHQKKNVNLLNQYS